MFDNILRNFKDGELPPPKFLAAFFGRFAIFSLELLFHRQRSLGNFAQMMSWAGRLDAVHQGELVGRVRRCVTRFAAIAAACHHIFSAVLAKDGGCVTGHFAQVPACK